MKSFAYAHGSTVEEVSAALDGTCRPLAGGTELVRLIKSDLAWPERVVDLKSIPGLDGVERREDGWHFGALVTLSRLANDEQVRAGLPVLAQAALESASPQLRHRATIGGNLLQRPRCWYFRDPLIHCWLKGGARCFAVDGHNERHALASPGPCYIVHPSDPAVALLALDARVVAAGPRGRRTVPISDFYLMPRQEAWSETVLDLDEVIVEVVVPVPLDGSSGAYVKVAERAVWDFALVSAAAQVTNRGGVVRAARLVLGGVAPVPWRVADAEAALLGSTLDEETIARAAEAATVGLHPLSRNGYKLDLLRGVVAEALRRQR
jgi:xanthine dehydrogenase YagS FAD-binding subunit